MIIFKMHNILFILCFQIVFLMNSSYHSYIIYIIYTKNTNLTWAKILRLYYIILTIKHYEINKMYGNNVNYL